MPTKKKLRYLDLSHNKLASSKKGTWNNLANFMSKLPSLKEINLSHSNISAAAVKPIIDCVPKLTTLNLSNNDFDEEGLAFQISHIEFLPLADTLVNLPRLKQLYLNRTLKKGKVTPAVVEKLIALIENKSKCTLEVLSIFSKAHLDPSRCGRHARFKVSIEIGYYSICLLVDDKRVTEGSESLRSSRRRCYGHCLG